MLQNNNESRLVKAFTVASAVYAGLGGGNPLEGAMAAQGLVMKARSYKYKRRTKKALQHDK